MSTGIATMMAIIIIHMILKSLESTATNIHTKRVNTVTSILQTRITDIHISKYPAINQQTIY